MAVEVVAGPVVMHGGARVGVPGSDLDVSEVNADIEHRRDESPPERVWSGPVLLIPAAMASLRTMLVQSLFVSGEEDGTCRSICRWQFCLDRQHA
jgi:hypothetical protein